MARVGVVTFPGTNCERETLRAFASVTGVETFALWHKDHIQEPLDLVILPGGFSYGDYLRAGSIAQFSPLMSDIIDFAHAGGYVMGICNGFQVLTESGLLPGALVRNQHLRFISKTLPIRVERTDSPWTQKCREGQILHIPVAHGEGNYVHHQEDLEMLEVENQVLVRYEDNLNGSMNAIAGISNKAGNVFGLMPHPERAIAERLGLEGGLVLLESIVEWINTHHAENSDE